MVFVLRLRAVFAALFLFALARPAAADRLDTALEKIIGKPVAWALVNASGTDDDPLLANWVRSLGASVSAQAPRRDIAYSFRILGTQVGNAQALPGGYIFVTRGLLDDVESDDELAGILAHESAHVSKRHATQQIGENLLALVLIGQIKGRNATEWQTAAQIANALRTLGKSRAHESQADALGLEFAQRAGYDPRGLVRFFERLDGGREPGRLAQYLATHPSPRRRLEASRRDPDVTQTDPARRAQTAAGYRARGYDGSARAALAGRDPLALPPPRAPVLLAPEPAAARRALLDSVDNSLRRLRGTYRTGHIGGVLQQILLVNYELDARWIYVAARAYQIQTQTQDVYAQTLRTLRTASPTYDALARSGVEAAAVATNEGAAGLAAEAARGQNEVSAAVRRAGEVAGPLTRAQQATATVLADLNNRLYHPKSSGLVWARYGALEGLLRYAEAELGRADRASAEAWQTLSVARVRRYQARIAQLAPTSDPARRALWADLAARRLFGDPARAGSLQTSGLPAGAATVQAALSIELNKPLELVAAGQGETPWADWIVQSRGSPANIATVLRLLSLDLERETAFRDDPAPANQQQQRQQPDPSAKPSGPSPAEPR